MIVLQNVNRINPKIRKVGNTIYIAVQRNGLTVTVSQCELGDAGVGAEVVQVTNLGSGEIWRSSMADLPRRSVVADGKITMLLDEFEKARSSHALQMIGRGR